MKLTLWDTCSASSTSGTSACWLQQDLDSYIHTQKTQGCSSAHSDAAALMFMRLFHQPVQGAEFNKALILLNMYLEIKLPHLSKCCSCTGNVSWYWKAGVQDTSLEDVLFSPLCPPSCAGLSVQSSCVVNSIPWAEALFTCWVVLCLPG